MRAYGNNGDGRLLRWMIASITMSILVSMIMMALVTWNDECVTLCARHWSGGGGARSGTVRNRHGILCLPTCGQIWLTHTNTLDLDCRNTKYHHHTNMLNLDGRNPKYHHHTNTLTLDGRNTIYHHHTNTLNLDGRNTSFEGCEECTAPQHQWL